MYHLSHLFTQDLDFIPKHILTVIKDSPHQLCSTINRIKLPVLTWDTMSVNSSQETR